MQNARKSRQLVTHTMKYYNAASLSLLSIMATVLLSLALSSPAHAADRTFDLDNYKGKVVYLDFWASWCGPCRQSFPFMNNLHQELQEQGLAVVSINVDKDRQKAAEFLAAIPASFEVYYDPDGELAKAYELKAMPSSFLYDRNGELLGSHLGFKKKDITELTESIKQILAQPQ